ncbi:MAG: TlpA family protein disulfide reductase [Acidimicrobiia bacterium]|nr:TlpA family protein disulfide reductase [Acidimicrobiia bacterium]
MENEQQPDALDALEAPEAPQAPARVSRGKAWIGMAAVAVALGMLTMIPEPGYDPDAPPPAADGQAGSEGDGGLLQPGSPAPLNYTMKDVNGTDVTLSSFKGKVILVNFWATWCAPCKVEIPHLVELQEQYKDDLVILGVSVDDTAEKMKPYAEQLKINYPLLVGLGHDDMQEAYGPLWGIPVSVFIDREGNVSKRHSGIATKEQFEREIIAAL